MVNVILFQVSSSQGKLSVVRTNPCGLKQEGAVAWYLFVNIADRTDGYTPINVDDLAILGHAIPTGVFAHILDLICGEGKWGDDEWNDLADLIERVVEDPYSSQDPIDRASNAIARSLQKMTQKPC